MSAQSANAASAATDAAPRQLSGRLVIATHNPGKLREMRELLAPYGIEAVSAGELGLAEPEETGTSFRANARIKAQAAAAASRLPAFADDSGLAVDALGGEPGIYSARWAGPNKDFRHAMRTVEDKLRARGGHKPNQRRAHFVSALCVAWPDGHVEEFEAAVDGTLVWPPRGDTGFRLRSDVPARRPRPHLRRDDERGEARPAAARQRPVASRPRVPQARGGVPWTALTAAVSPLSASTCIGRSACRSARIATSTAMCATPRIDEARFARAFAAEIAATAARVPGRTVVDHLLRRRHAVADAARNRRRDPRRRRTSTGPVAADVEVTLEANPTSVEATRFRGYRAAGVNRVSLGVQALDDAALAALGRLHSAREALDAVAVARAIFDRNSFDLIYARPRPDAGGLGRRARARHRGGRRASLALSAHHRAGDAVCRAACGRQARRPRRRHRARALRHDAGGLRAMPACPPTRFPTMRGRAPSAGTISSTGARTNMPASGRAPMAGSTSKATRRATATEQRPEAWLMRVESLGHGVVTDDALTRGADGRRVPADGLAARRGHRSRALCVDRWASARPPAHRAQLREQGVVETTANGSCA